jgi:hypothetical protein
MAGKVALDDVDLTKAGAGNNPPADDINEGQPESPKDTGKDTGKPSDEISDAGGDDSPGEGTTGGKSDDSFHVGTKTYSRVEAEEALSKLNKFQGDRDRSESALRKMVENLNAQGFQVSEDLRVSKVETKPTVTKKELISRATAGDEQAMEDLLAQERQEVLAETTKTSGSIRTTEKILEHIHKFYPGMYNEDGTPNPESPISQEAQKIINQFPQLGTTQSLPAVAKMAQNNLTINNLASHDQKVRDEAIRKLAKSSGKAISAPADGVPAEDLSNLLSSEQTRVIKRLGSDPNRVARIIKKAQQGKGGYEL